MNLEMICTCKLSGVREAEDRRVRIAERMQLPRMSDLATAIVLSLAFDFGCDAWISADMWFGVSVETALVPDGISVECDHPIDGLAAIWEHLADRFPERVSVAPDYRASGSALLQSRFSLPSAIQSTEACSARLFAQCVATDVPYQEHRATVHEGKDGWCDDCSRIHNPYVEAHVALDEVWGSESLEPAINAAFGDNV